MNYRYAINKRTVFTNIFSYWGQLNKELIDCGLIPKSRTFSDHQPVIVLKFPAKPILVCKPQKD